VLRALLNEIVDVAKHGGLTKLEAEFNGEREEHHPFLQEVRVWELVRLEDYLQDMGGTAA